VPHWRYIVCALSSLVASPDVLSSVAAERDEGGARRAAALSWALVLLPWAAVVVFCLVHEPVLRDGWGHHLWWREGPLSWQRLWVVARANYFEGNPRFGQTVTLLLYGPALPAVAATTALALALPLAVVALALGRWPSWRRAEDAWLYAIALAALCTAAPQIGPMFFYRPFVGNYVYGFAPHLLLYALYAVAGAPRWPLARALLVLPLGVLAGLGNEHTGPASLALLAFWVYQRRRRGERGALWWSAGLLGLALGYVALYAAPGQAVRYAGLAQQHSLWHRVVARPPLETLEIIGIFALAAACTTPWWWLAARARRRRQHGWSVDERRATTAWLGAAAAMTATLLASPKFGPRLYFAPVALLVVAAMSYLAPTLAWRDSRRAPVALAAVALVVCGAALLHAYAAAGPEGRHRVAVLHAAPPHSAVRLAPLSTPRSRWFLGDDMVVDSLRVWLAGALELSSIELTRPPSPTR
jgi:Family of unknown function (DUF6056)